MLSTKWTQGVYQRETDDIYWRETEGVYQRETSCLPEGERMFTGGGPGVSMI